MSFQRRIWVKNKLGSFTLGLNSSGTTPFVGAFDSYSSGIDAAWSVSRRVLSSYTGPLIRVRRGNDNQELDINYLASGLLDTASLSAFVAGASAYLTKIYAQAGSKDMVQATAAL